MFTIFSKLKENNEMIDLVYKCSDDSIQCVLKSNFRNLFNQDNYDNAK